MFDNHPTPLIIQTDQSVVAARRKPLGAGAERDEKWLQNFIFAHPAVIPTDQIDSAYTDLIPICTELGTSVGRIDALFATASGRLVLVETKLWRNPQARREVVAQALDYAADLATHSFDKLDAAVRNRNGAGIVETASAYVKDFDETVFCDNLIRSLSEGRFLILICGDGIKEQAQGISDFLNRFTSLDFSFGLVELALYEALDGATLVIPRVQAKSVTLERRVFRLEGARQVVEESSTELPGDSVAKSPPDLAVQLDWQEYWTDLAKSLSENTAKYGELYSYRKNSTKFQLKNSDLFITAFFAESFNECGIFMSYRSQSPSETTISMSQEIANRIPLVKDEDLARLEGFRTDTTSVFSVTRPWLDITDRDSRQTALQFQARALDVLVPVISRMVDELLAEK